MLGTTLMTDKYIDVNKQCGGDDVDNITNIAFPNKEKITKHKINIIWILCH